MAGTVWLHYPIKLDQSHTTTPCARYHLVLFNFFFFRVYSHLISFNAKFLLFCYS